jgi:hypothetical protein
MGINDDYGECGGGFEKFGESSREGRGEAAGFGARVGIFAAGTTRGDYAHSSGTHPSAKYA